MSATHDSLFRPSEEKIGRAMRKLNELEAPIRRYIEANPYELRVEEDAERSYVIARRVKDAPGDFGWETVEINGHLRDALDKLMSNVVAHNGRGTSGVGYPFGGLDNGQPNPFPDGRMTRKGGIKEKLTADQWRLIEIHKPYPGGNTALWAVNEIANANKHRKDLVEVKPRLRQRVGLISGCSGTILFNPVDCDFVLADKKRETVLLALGHDGFNRQIQHDVAADIVFANVPVVQGAGVLETLHEQLRLVQNVVRGFRELLSRTG